MIYLDHMQNSNNYYYFMFDILIRLTSFFLILLPLLYKEYLHRHYNVQLYKKCSVIHKKYINVKVY